MFGPRNSPMLKELTYIDAILSLIDFSILGCCSLSIFVIVIGELVYIMGRNMFPKQRKPSELLKLPICVTGAIINVDIPRIMPPSI